MRTLNVGQFLSTLYQYIRLWKLPDQYLAGLRLFLVLKSSETPIEVVKPLWPIT